MDLRRDTVLTSQNFVSNNRCLTSHKFAAGSREVREDWRRMNVPLVFLWFCRKMVYLVAGDIFDAIESWVPAVLFWRSGVN